MAFVEDTGPAQNDPITRARYILVGGNPIKQHRGGTAFTSLRVLGSCFTLGGAKDLYKEYYEEAGGLLLVIDTHTGSEAQMD